MRQLALTALAVFISSAAWAQEAAPGDKFLGLLVLPALCASPCPRSDEPVPLYEAPHQDEPAAAISRALYFRDNPAVQNQQSPLWPVADEYERDRYGAAVFEAVPGSAYKIRIGELEYWVKAENAGTFHPYPQILEGRLTYLSAWDLRLWDMPQGDFRIVSHPFIDDPALATEIPVRILSLRRVDGRWWMHVEIYDRSPCTETRPPFFAQGWVPAHTADGVRTAWFDPEGC